MITIAWDVDDILNDLMRAWLTQKWLPAHPDCKVRFEQIIRNPPEEIIGGTKEEYQRSLDDFRLSRAYLDLPPDAQVLEWFTLYGDQARHLALTSVPVKAAHISAEWVIRNFGKWIRSFNFIPSPRTGEVNPEYDRNKADYLQWLNKADILIEDSPENIRQAEEKGIKGILVAQPWNKSSLPFKDALVQINKLL
jgi:5'(3')-deoxyribonucleotidase